MKFLIDFSDSATQVEINLWLSQNSIDATTAMNSLTNVYIVETAIVPVVGGIVESVVEDVNISNQLLSTVEIIPASSGASSTFDHDADWWKTASSYEVDFNDATTTFKKRGAKTSVYVVDSGITASHPEFATANIVNLFSFNENFDDTNGHGTALASVIAGETLGITNSTVKVVKVFDNTKTTMISDLVRAFDAIHADLIATASTSIGVVNLSWSIPKNAYIESKIQALIDAGGYVVAAAGNDGTPIQDVTPASMDSVMTIGAYDQNFVPAVFSNYTSAISNAEGEVNHGALDAWAPGVDISAALMNGTIGTVSGTSVAAAIVSACLAYNSDNMYSGASRLSDFDQILEMSTFQKKNILVLGDKYSASINAITSFVSKASTGLTHGSYKANRTAWPTESVHLFIAPNAFVTKIELDAELPAGLSLSNGWIVGTLTSPPAESEILNYTVTVTYEDGSVNTFSLRLWLPAEGTTVGEYPADLQLLYPPGCYYGADCNAFCGGYYCRDCGKTNCQCSNEDCM